MIIDNSNVRFRGKAINDLNQEELRDALFQALNRVAELEDAQQSMHWIGRESAPFQALSTPEVLSIAQADTNPPANQ